MLVMHKPPVHLTYCTNVHAAESWVDTFEKLVQYLPKIKKQVCSEASFGIGLRLSAVAAKELRKKGRLQEFKTWLEENDLYVFTLNGFPYGQFHAAPVKDQVYAPDWRAEARTGYTLDLIEVLAGLLPADVMGSISTLPASYKPWFAKEQGVLLPQEQSATNLAAIALRLWELERTSGKLIRLGLEPEPDGLIEDTEELIAYFERFLVPAVIRAAHRCGTDAFAAERIARRYIGICFDTCHASVQYESPHTALARLASAGIAVTKLQVSSALRIEWQRGPDVHQVLNVLRALNDPVYLHQVREKRIDGSVRRFNDLPDALIKEKSADAAEWRIHFHVPVFLPNYGPLSSTHEDTAQYLRLCIAHGWCDHFEIETYTWDVLPPDLRTDLVHSIVQEFGWTTRQIDESTRKSCVAQ
jgi:hypothetical protein